MARLGSGRALLLTGVSHLAMGTAWAASAPSVESQAHVAIGIAVLICGYCGWKGLRRNFRGAGSSFWTSTLGRWLIGRMAGTVVLGGLLGIGFLVPAYALLPVMQVLLSLGIPLTAYSVSGIALTMWIGAAVAAWRLRTIVKVCIGRGSRPLRRLVRSLGMGGGGSSAFAGICEEWACRWKPGMILLGASLFDRKWRVGIRDDRGVGVVAGNGAGKGRSSIIPNLLTYPGSIYCQDFKGQNAAVTAQRRRDMGQAVHILEPMGEGGARFNPLQALDPSAMDYVEQIDAIVDALVIAGDAKSLFWDESARTLIAGLIDYVVRRDGNGDEFEPPADDEATEDTDAGE